MCGDTSRDSLDILDIAVERGKVMGDTRPIGAVDTLWLNMDRPNNLMAIDTLVFFDEPVDWERLVAVVRERLIQPYPVFRQRPVAPLTSLGLAHWEDDPGFRLERHLHHARLPAPGDDDAVRRYIEPRLRRPLDHDHPLWEVHLIDGYHAGAVLYARFHHAIGDGFALTHLLLSLTDATSEGEPGTMPEAADADESRPTGLIGSVLGVAGAAQRAAAVGARGASRLTRGLPRLVTRRGMGDAFIRTWHTAEIVNKLVFSRNPATSLDGDPGVGKTVVWSQPYPLADVKLVGRLAGATVNDVLVSALAGAISTYLVDRGESATDLTTMVPVNLRPTDRVPSRELGNRFALVMLRLPSSVSAPLARLAETKRRMDVIKHSPEAVITFGLIAAIGRTVMEVERLLVDFFAGKAIGVTTNVIGPATPRYLAGTRIAGILAWVPSSGRQTIGVCIFSYDDTVRVGFKVDTDTVREPEKLLCAFDTQLEMLLRMSRAAQRSVDGSSRSPGPRRRVGRTGRAHAPTKRPVQR